MQVCEAPDPHIEMVRATIFLAGGITNCRDWQAEFLGYMGEEDPDIVIYNPRRANFPIDDPSAAKEQIEWEHARLRITDTLAFWFSKETLNPITLFELGRWGLSYYDRPLVIGIDPEYKRRLDVEIQTQLSRPTVPICYDVKELAERALEQTRIYGAVK